MHSACSFFQAELGRGFASGKRGRLACSKGNARFSCKSVLLLMLAIRSVVSAQNRAETSNRKRPLHKTIRTRQNEHAYKEYCTKRFYTQWL